MELRKATPEDLDFLVELRNERASVLYSRRGILSKELIRKDYFDNPKKKPHVLLEDGVRVGYVIYELVEPGIYEISVALLPGERGKGKGSELTRLGTTYCVEELKARKVIAMIQPENSTSIRTFQGVGYVEDGRVGDLLRFIYE